VVEVKSAVGDTVKKRPAAPEGTEQRCCRRLPDLPQGAERRTAGAIESARQTILYDKGAVAKSALEQLKM